MTRRDPPHDPEAVYTLRLLFSERARGSVREANAAEVQGAGVTVAQARQLVRQYGAEAELLEPDGHVRWVIGRGGALRAKRRPGAKGKIKHPSAGPALARVHVRVTREHKAAIVAACQRAGCTVTQAVEALPDLLALLDGTTGGAVYKVCDATKPGQHRECRTCGYEPCACDQQ